MLLNVIAGFDERDSTSIDHPVPDYVAGLNGSLKGLRVGIVRQHFDAGLDEATGKAVREAVAAVLLILRFGLQRVWGPPRDPVP